MLRFLFPRLTANPERGASLFAAATERARKQHWYVEGQVPDTLDGRFRALATLTALVVVRVEQDGEAGDAVSVALTERFIEVMEAEHREFGLGDPKLGRTVRKLVGSLARRVEIWRRALAAEPMGWEAATRESLYEGEVDERALRHSAEALREFWSRLEAADLGAIAGGKLQ